MRFISESDKKYVKRLVMNILARGFYIGINDGERVEFSDGRKVTEIRREIFENIGETGEDNIIIFKKVKDGDGYKYKRYGSFFLIYNNGDGEEVICDYVDNKLCHEIYNEVCR